MNEAELKARKAAVDFVNAHFTDFESLDRVYDVYHDVHKAHEASRQQLEEQVNGDGLLSTCHFRKWSGDDCRLLGANANQWRPVNFITTI